jgi:hypothetical protein
MGRFGCDHRGVAAQARIASLNAELRATEDIKAKWETEVRGSGKWEDEFKVGFPFLSLLGQNNQELSRRFLNGPDCSTRPARGQSRI